MLLDMDNDNNDSEQILFREVRLDDEIDQDEEEKEMEYDFEEYERKKK